MWVLRISQIWQKNWIQRMMGTLFQMTDGKDRQSINVWSEIRSKCTRGKLQTCTDINFLWDTKSLRSQHTSRKWMYCEISRAQKNLRVRGHAQPNTYRLKTLYGYSPITNPSLGMYPEIHPMYRAFSIDSVEINTSLIIMKECDIPLFMSNYKMANVILTGVEYGCFLLPRTRFNPLWTEASQANPIVNAIVSCAFEDCLRERAQSHTGRKIETTTCCANDWICCNISRSVLWPIF